MRKIYNLLLLGAFMLLGAQSAWADNFFSGDNNGFAEASGTKFVSEGTPGQIVARVNLGANKIYEFEIFDNSNGDKYWGNTGTIYSNTNFTNWWKFEQGKGHAKIKTAAAGEYVFIVSWGNDNYPYLYVAYPGVSYTISFDNTVDWNPLNAHVWATDPAIINLTGDFPGADVYSTSSKTVTTTHWPSQVIWSKNGDPTDRIDKQFINGAEYDGGGDIYQKVTIAAGGWASFSPSDDVEVDDDADLTVYRAELNAAAATLTAYPIDVAKIKKGVGVLLKNTAASEKTFSFKVTTGASAIASTNNLFGTTVRSLRTDLQGAADHIMVLQSGTSNFVSYTGDFFPANKAYILFTATSAPDRLRVVEAVDNATDFQSVEASEKAVKFIKNGQLFIQKDGVVYDATGRAVR